MLQVVIHIQLGIPICQLASDSLRRYLFIDQCLGDLRVMLLSIGNTVFYRRTGWQNILFGLSQEPTWLQNKYDQ
jgi:hypothetical protein